MWSKIGNLICSRHLFTSAAVIQADFFYQHATLITALLSNKSTQQNTINYQLLHAQYNNLQIIQTEVTNLLVENGSVRNALMLITKKLRCQVCIALANMRPSLLTVGWISKAEERNMVFGLSSSLWMYVQHSIERDAQQYTTFVSYLMNNKSDPLALPTILLDLITHAELQFEQYHADDIMSLKENHFTSTTMQEIISCKLFNPSALTSPSLQKSNKYN